MRKHSRSRVIWPILLFTAIAFAMRLWRLEFQSLWWDEGVSIYLAGAGIPALTFAKDFAVDLHPPGYHLLLGFWRSLVGPSVFTMRFLSVVAGVLTVPLVARLGASIARADARGRVGVLAALLATVSPIAVYYGQETRMYPFLPLLGALSLYVTFRVVRQPTRRSWLLWFAANLVSWYVYYYFVFWTLALALGLLIWALQTPSARMARLRSWLVAQTGLVVGFLPWLFLLAPFLSSASSVPVATEVHLTPMAFVEEIAQDFTLGFAAPPDATVLLAGWALLAVLGAIVTLRRDRTLLGLLLLTGLLPIAGAGAILVVRPFFYPRFILFVLVPLWLLVSLALGEARRNWLPAILVLPLVAGSLWTYNLERLTPRIGYSSNDYQTVFATLAEEARPGDLVLCDYPWQAGYVDAYLSQLGVRPVYLPVTTASNVSTIASPNQPIWVFSYDPTGHFAETSAEQALTASLPVRVADRSGDSQVTLFAKTSPLPDAPSPGARATFAGGISLAHATLSATTLAPGDTISILLDWRASAAQTTGYHVFVHLLGPDGKVAAQKDSPPLDGRFPTSSWPAGSEYVDRYALALPASAGPGIYQVEVGMYRPDDGVRLRALSGSDHDNRILLGSVKVGR